MKYPTAQAFETTFADLCTQALLNAPNRALIRFRASDTIETWTVSEIMSRALMYARQITDFGIKPKDQVAVMLDNHPDHAAVMLALALTGTIWLPLDRRFTATNIRRVLSQADASVAIAEVEYTKRLNDSGFTGQVIHRHHGRTSTQSFSDAAALMDALLAQVSTTVQKPDDIRALIFTSGTTGPPKGVIVTERMYMASALFCGYASDAKPSSVFYLWEPLNHIGGAQIIPMALLSGCSIAMSTKFSVSRFWPEVIEMQATRIHYLGGILELLLRQDVSPLDQQHQVTLGFGAGASEKISREFTARFNIPLREVYGMTEASSFTTMNFTGPLNSIGKPLRDFDLIIVNDKEEIAESGETGEICIKPTRNKLITPGYYKNDLATKEAFHNDYFRTGDLAWQDSASNVFFVGRRKELIRTKGENVSAWEIESVFKQHPCVLEAAVVGVESDLTEQDIAAFIRLIELPEQEYHQAKSEIKALIRQELAPFQQPNYVVEVTRFPKTPSERIEKHKLDTSKSALTSSWQFQP